MGGIWRIVSVSRAVRNMRAVRVNYEDFSSSYDEYLSLDSIRSADNDSNVSWDDLIPETTVKCFWGSNSDLYYAKVKEKTSSDFLRIRITEISSDFDRWVEPKELRMANT
mmetsp:Transcript_23237/g.36040  ORF Transcript_23237/g.36040 Transcript_23237/m.36040 type:complete len:110 (+) Transcript_23237:128-457(+)